MGRGGVVERTECLGRVGMPFEDSEFESERSLAGGVGGGGGGEVCVLAGE